MTTINPLIFRAYDIRGIAIPEAGEIADLTPETVKLIGQGTGTYMKRKYGTRNMMVGRDNRLHSPDLQKAFIEGVLSTGIDVVDVGISTSPLIYYAVCRYGMDSGVNITASHNPKEYNGVKIVGKNAHSVCGDELQEIVKLILANDFERQDEQQAEHTTKSDNFDDYLKDIQARIKLAKPLKVVVDAGNGVTGPFAPKLLRAIGCKVIELYCDLDGNFPHHEANPEEEKNMLDLAEQVRINKADLGIGFDGDGDRVGIVDENGKHYSADYLLLLLVRDLLENVNSAKVAKASASDTTPNNNLASNSAKQIVFDVKVSKILIDEITRLGGTPVMSKTGHSFIEARMHELNAPLGGEISGHMFFGKTYYDYYGFDDAFFAACKLLEILSKTQKSFSEQFNGLPTLFTTPEFKAHCPDNLKFEIVKKVTDHFTKLYDCITIDGVRINFDTLAWGAIRCSNTSPNLTLRFEAETAEKLAQIQNIMVEELKKYPEVDLSWHKTT
ncbi:MAG: phosphomannomutase/phosphoglucomutase [Candidatus Gracilibacteria bacterium]|jgi:phosphomannomutase/phosphoglucomutase